MPRGKKEKGKPRERTLLNDPYAVPTMRFPTDAVLVSNLRKEVDEWRNSDNPGISDTTRELLNFWFNREHIVVENGVRKPFRYYFCQREAIETLIYLYEVKELRRLGPMFDQFAEEQRLGGWQFPGDDFPKYCFKMATGSGKTKVMSLAVVWSYFHKLYEPDSPLTKNFLIIAPNVIVFERLKKDFGNNGAIFREDPLIPEHWKADWQLTCLTRDDSISLVGAPNGTLLLTNIQQLYKRGESEDLDHPVGALLPPKPKKDIETSSERLLDKVISIPEIMIINDEAHHVHDPDLVWSQTIKNIHRACASLGDGLVAHLDFTATPRDQAGRIFPHIIVDYPLAKAIDDGIVKRVLVGKVRNPKENPSDNFATRFKVWIDAGINRWREYWNNLSPAGLRPVLFIMADKTTSADEVFDYLETEPDLAGKTLLIHTDRIGNVSKREEDRIRQAARDIDKPTSPHRAVVSVMMLREGWDVKNVNVVVGLRAFTAKADILPEQTVGRGLRLMEGPDSGRDETLDIIGNDKFVEIVKDLEAEGVKLGTFTAGDKTDALAVGPIPERMRWDIEVPLPTSKYSAHHAILEDLKLDKIPKYQVDLGAPGDFEKIRYEGYDARELAEKGKVKPEIVREWDYEKVRNGMEVISYFTQRIIKRAKLTSDAFSILAPLVMEYIDEVLFGEKVSYEDEAVVERLNHEDAQSAVLSAFAEGITKLTIKAEEVQFKRKFSMSETKPFSWSQSKTSEGKKTVFNLVVWDNHLERDFAQFLDNCSDVKAYAKLAHWKTPLCMEYLSVGGGIRYYYPDFVVEAVDGKKYIVEPKGMEREEEPQKEARATEWCRDVSEQSGESWAYVKVPEVVFRQATATSFAQLVENVREAEKVREPQLALALGIVAKEELPDNVVPFVNALPVYSLKAAAGKFGEGRDVEEEGWVEVDIVKTLDEKMFVAQVVGKSMEPRIPDGSYCIFRAHPEGTRQGKIVLVQHQDIDDSETGGKYTVKEYESEKAQAKDGSWRHLLIRLKPLNPEYEPIEFKDVDEGSVQLIAEFITVLPVKK